ncbi:MAG: four helix bundle protein [Ignavibacteriae bacterium]|nr:four helix bundle protein [Ignavibacteriota bacterium]
MIEYTKLRNINRGYMKLDVWQRAMDLYRFVWDSTSNKGIDFKLRSQIVNAAQSVSSNISEGYCRKSVNEYVQFLYIGLGSLGETMTRMIGLNTTNQMSESQFREFDILHYEIENKMLRLIESLEKKKDDGTWVNRISEDIVEYNP